jgi:hypothetical protein
MRRSLTGVAMSVVVLGGLSMAPSLAATPDTSGTASVQNTAPPSERNPALADTGQVRASKIIGSNVYNRGGTLLASGATCAMRISVSQRMTSRSDQSSL